MSYNQKPPGSGGSGMGGGGGGGGGGPPNGPNNIPQVAKTFAGIQQQMQNLVHGQNPLPQSSQADLNAFLQQQRIQSMLKQQQQFLQFQQHVQHQQQQQQQQQQQHHNMSGGGAGAGGGVAVGAAASGPGSGSGGGGGGSGEPLALTRTPGAAELLNKTYQQQANGNPTANPTFNQFQQTLQSLPTNFVQQLQAIQYQFQAKQMHQQQHSPGTPQGGAHLAQQQGVPQGVPQPPSTTALSHQQQQQQKHHQQQNAALSTVAAVQQFQQRYLSAAAQAVASGNKLSSAAAPPPPLTNQMKPPNLPPNTQITPVSGANISGGAMSSSGSSSSHQKGPANTAGSGSNKHPNPQPPPSISLTPTKPPSSAPSAAHQQNKFTPPINPGATASSSGHTQNILKPPYSSPLQIAFKNSTSPAKGGSNVDAATGAALKSPQSTPVQLTKQTPTAATTATIGNKMVTATPPITTGATAMATPQKATTQSSPPTTTSTTTTTAPPQQSIPPTSALKTPPPSTAAPTPTTAAPPPPPLSSSEASIKSSVSEKEPATKPPTDSNKKPTESSAALAAGVVPETPQKKDTEKPTTDKKIETVANKTTTVEAAKEIKSNTTSKPESKSLEENKKETDTKLTKPEILPADVPKINSVKNSSDLKESSTEKKNATNSEDKSSTTITSKTAVPESPPKPEAVPVDQKSDIQNDPKKFNDEKDIDKKVDGKKIDEKNTDEKKIDEKKIDGKSTDGNKEAIADKISTAKSEILVVAPTTAKVAELTKPSMESHLPTVTVKPSEKVESSEKATAIPEQKTKSQQKSSKEGAGKQSEQKITLSSYSTEGAEAISKDIPKEKEEQSKLPIKSVGKPEIINSTKSNATSTKPNGSDTVKESNENSTVVATVSSFAPTPAKKQARPAKVTKPKATTVPTVPSSDSKTTEKPDDKLTPASARTKRKSKVESYVSDSAPSTPKDDDLDRKSKRHRLKTILYQSPLPELAFITKLSASEASNSPKPMSNEDRLIVFYKNEYMAVRNAEGTFYLCQTMQNVYRTSPRISIRWLSEDPKDSNVYIPDFYDHTDIECVLTTVELKRIDKGHMRLPKSEKTRIESILKKAIDVEKGLVPRPELTEENPDGLDISLFKDESQIEKKSLSVAEVETGTPAGATSSRKSRRANANTSSPAKPSAQTPSTATSNKLKRSAVSSSSASKSPAKKRKTLIKRKKKKADNSDDEEDEETSDDYESDMEYKPTQKRTSVNTSASKSTPRAQRSPLAKARAASPITPTTSRSRNVPQKATHTPSPSTASKATRGERAAKRKSLTDTGSSEEATPAKRPAITSANNSKTTNKSKTSENVSLEEAATIPVNTTNSSDNSSKASETTLTTIPNTSNPASIASNSPLCNNGAAAAAAVVGDGDDGGGSGASDASDGGNRPSRCRK